MVDGKRTGELLLKVGHALALRSGDEALASLPLASLPETVQGLSRSKASWVKAGWRHKQFAGHDCVGTFSCCRMVASMVRVRVVSTQLT